MFDLRESDVVTLHLPPTQAWLPLLDQIDQAGAALLPIDHRLKQPEVQQLITLARPTVVVDGTGRHRVRGNRVDHDIALVVATSGTRGEPRLVELTRAAVDAAVNASIERLKATADDPWLCCLPLAHMGGLLVLLRARALGARVHILERFDVEAFGKVDARFTALVPTMLHRLLETGMPLDRYRSILVGGAALDPEIARAPLISTYGMTESCGGVVYDGLPLPGVEVRVDKDDEIQMHGPMVMRGYRLDPQATKAAFTTDGWLRTNDAGSIREGMLTIHGRLDDVIVTGGEKVWPDEVEAVLRLHPAVTDAAVAGRPDPEWGARVMAFIVPATIPPSLEELRTFCHDQLAAYKAPRELLLVDEIPRTPSGKIARARLPHSSDSATQR